MLGRTKEMRSNATWTVSSGANIITEQCRFCCCPGDCLPWLGVVLNAALISRCPVDLAADLRTHSRLLHTSIRLPSGRRRAFSAVERNSQELARISAASSIPAADMCRRACSREGLGFEFRSLRRGVCEPSVPRRAGPHLPGEALPASEASSRQTQFLQDSELRR